MPIYAARRRTAAWVQIRAATAMNMYKRQFNETENNVVRIPSIDEFHLTSMNREDGQKR